MMKGAQRGWSGVVSTVSWTLYCDRLALESPRRSKARDYTLQYPVACLVDWTIQGSTI